MSPASLTPLCPGTADPEGAGTHTVAAVILHGLAMQHGPYFTQMDGQLDLEDCRHLGSVHFLPPFSKDDYTAEIWKYYSCF